MAVLHIGGISYVIVQIMELPGECSG